MKTLNIGEAYTAISMSGKQVIPLTISPKSNEIALFVVPTKTYQKFVVWNYHNLPTAMNLIELCNGRYYNTMEDALLRDPYFCNDDINNLESILSK